MPAADGPLRFAVRVKPGAGGPSVGGTWGDDGALNVSVTEKAIDGKANAAVIALLAKVLKLRKRQLSIVQGATHRTKVIEVSEPAADLDARIAALRRP